MAETQEIDRISSLPDDILTHILSFLPTKQAVATSVLSNRWKFTWMGVPVLDFVCKTTNHLSSFENFVDRGLRLNNSHSLRFFRFHIYEEIKRLQLWSWMKNVLGRDVCEVDIACFTFEVDKKPPTIVESISNDKLKVLKLDGYGIEYPLWFPLSNLFLPNLLILHFLNFGFENDPFVSGILLALPCLKELRILNCLGLQSLSICSSSLKRFEMHMEMLSLSIEAPSLEYLLIRNNCSNCKYEFNVPSLVESNFIFMGRECNSLVHLLKQVPGLRSLRMLMKTYILPSTIVQLLQEEHPLFPKLTHLNIPYFWLQWTSLRLSVILLFCEQAPNLESLVCWDTGSGVDEQYQLENPVPKCLSSTLKEIDIYSVERGYPDNLVTNFLLRHAMVLKVVRIHMNRRSENADEAISWLKKFPMASSNCELKIIDL